jgi:serine/threonine protein kinase
VKLSDFSNAKYVKAEAGGADEQQQQQQAYSAKDVAQFSEYRAPEIYKGGEYTTSSDIYSFGIILWELVMKMLTGTYEFPYLGIKCRDLDQLLVFIVEKHMRPPIPVYCPNQWSTLIEGCLAPNPQKRPTSSDLVRILTAEEGGKNALLSESVHSVKTQLKKNYIL